LNRLSPTLKPTRATRAAKEAKVAKAASVALAKEAKEAKEARARLRASMALKAIKATYGVINGSHMCRICIFLQPEAICIELHICNMIYISIFGVSDSAEILK